MFMKSFAITAALVAAAPALAQTTAQYGDVQVTNAGPGGSAVFQLTSVGTSPGYGGIYFHYDTPIALSSITQLSTDYQMVQGTFALGSPRFTFFDAGNNAAYVYFGTESSGNFSDPLAGAYGNTGNYANLASTDIRVQSNGFGGYNSGYPYITWATFLANVGSTGVMDLTVDVDGGYGSNNTQQALVNNFTVNNAVLTPRATPAVPEPATWAMMIVGFGMVGGAVRRRKATIAFA